MQILISFNVYVSRYRLLESRLEETVQQTMRIKEEKISSLEKKVEDSNALNATLLAELATVRLHVCRQEMHSDLSLLQVFIDCKIYQKQDFFLPNVHFVSVQNKNEFGIILKY